MRITWYGHAAFLIETQGLRIILDPYRSPDSGGYLPIDEPADLVVVSHENDRYHSHLGQIVPPFQVVRALELPAGGRGDPRHPLPGHPRLRDAREEAGRRGDDHPLPRRRGCIWSSWATWGTRSTRPSLLRSAAPRSCWLPAGGPPTIDFPDIPPLLDAIGPRLVLPMHYKTPKINLNIQPVERFLELFPDDGGDPDQVVHDWRVSKEGTAADAGRSSCSITPVDVMNSVCVDWESGVFQNVRATSLFTNLCNSIKNQRGTLMCFDFIAEFREWAPSGTLRLRLLMIVGSRAHHSMLEHSMGTQGAAKGGRDVASREING